MADADIPKHELLLKLLRMTESDNDGEALNAMRKANALLRAGGWDWDKLLTAKIRIVANPFAGTPSPFATMPRERTAPPSQPRPAPTPPPPPAAKKTTWPLGTLPNKFVGFCYCCGIETVAQAGFIFKPFAHHERATNDWRVSCATCNTRATVTQNQAPPVRKKGKASINDLM